MNDHVHPVFRTILNDAVRGQTAEVRRLRDQHLRDGAAARIELRRAQQRIAALEADLRELHDHVDVTARQHAILTRALKNAWSAV